MKHQTDYKGYQITISPAAIEDWKGQSGYEVVLKKPGHPVVTSFNNYENAMQALAFAKSKIDNNTIPKNPSLLDKITRIFS